MKTTVQTRLARHAGLVLLSLLVFATGVQVAQAVTVAGTQDRGGVVALASTPTAGTEGRGVAAAFASTPARGAQDGGGMAAAPFAPASGALAASSGTLSTVAWIIVGSALALLVIGLAAWAWVRRRRQRSEPLSVVFCARHPEHAMCETA